MVYRVPFSLPPVVRDLVPGVVSGGEVDARGLRVVVTGAGGTFGREITRVLTSRGARVVGLDLVAGDEVLGCDVTDDDSVAAAVPQALDRLGGLDVLINNAGVGGPAPAEFFPGAEVRRQLEINLLGTWRVTAAAKDALAGRHPAA